MGRRRRLPAAAWGLAVTLASCAAAPSLDERFLVKVADARLARDPGCLAQEVNARTGLVVSPGAAISEDMLTLSIRCQEAEGGCERAVRALQASGLFKLVQSDRKASRQ